MIRSPFVRVPLGAATAALVLSACGGTVGWIDAGDDGGTGGVGAGGVGPHIYGGSGGIGHGGKPPIPPLVETDYGDVPIGGAAEIDVWPGALGVTAVLHAPTADDIVGFQSAVAPNGLGEIQNYRIAGTTWDFAWSGVSVAAVPQSDSYAAMPPMAGMWKLTVGAPQGGDAKSVKLSVWRRQTLDGNFHGGLLDVNVFIAGDATTVEYMNGVVHDAFDDWAGLALGNVSFHAM